MTETDDQPVDCPRCGTELILDEKATEMTGNWVTATDMMVTGQFICPNPDCPGADSDLAPAAPGQV